MSVYTSGFEPRNFLILVVDDCRRNLAFLQEILEEANYQTIIATSGEQALNRLKGVTPSLIILDLIMPELDGLKLCEYIKSQSKYTEIPIIFLTVSNKETDIVAAFDKGATDYITKPYKHNEVLARIKTHLQLKQAQDCLRSILSQQEIEIQKLEQLVIKDSLTEIYNRRHIFFLGEEEFKKCQRYHKSFSLIILDIDFFKLINDNYGHPAGDHVLKIVSSSIEKQIREIDYVGRIGGEEFMIILPETNFPHSYAVAERIKQSIANLSIPIPNSHKIVNITISLGLVVYDSDHYKYSNFEEMVQEADMALYESKNNGRNQISHYCQ